MDDPQSSTQVLLLQARSGDRHAISRLFSRILTFLRGHAHGRIPHNVRDQAETLDLAQDVALHVWRRLPDLELVERGDLDAYLRRSVRNHVLKLARRAEARVTKVGIGDEDEPADERPSPLQAAISREGYARYQAILGRMPLRQRMAVISRVEMGHDYEHVAAFAGCSSAAAAQRIVSRALEAIRAGWEPSEP